MGDTQGRPAPAPEMPATAAKRPGPGGRVAFVLLTALLAAIVAAYGLIISVADAFAASYPPHGPHRHLEYVIQNAQVYVLAGILLAVLVVGVVRWVRGRSTRLIPLLGLAAVLVTFVAAELIG